jgi:hypothetical protein
MILPKPTTKPKQREYLDALIHVLEMGLLSRAEVLVHLRVLRRNMRNRPPVKRGKPVAQSVTPRVRRQVERMFRANPLITNQTIADALNLNGGRVSEILAGKRQ